jgi:hypothetical protein
MGFGKVRNTEESGCCSSKCQRYLMGYGLVLQIVLTAAVERVLVVSSGMVCASKGLRERRRRRSSIRPL